jgi:hypothetical protein
MHDGLTQLVDEDAGGYAEIEATQDATQDATQGGACDSYTTQDATFEATQCREDKHKTRRHRQPNQRVMYVTMRRREHANVVMLSSEEKYCYAKAAFEPVMKHLAGLPSPAFFTAVRSWKQIVLRGMNSVGASSSDATSMPDEVGRIG